MPSTSAIPADRRVKGSVIVDYVKVMRANPQLPWADFLSPADLEQLNHLLLPASWYPIELFDRLGVAVFKLVSHEKIEIVHAFGRFLAERMHRDNPGLVSGNRPFDAIRKYFAILSRLYSFTVAECVGQESGRTEVVVHVRREDAGSRILTEVTLATMARLLELAGAKNVRFQPLQAIWLGHPHTRMELTWEEK